ncbi:MAG: tRNA (adenosine(37)-N6)-threonylcarbamoyltransferase complex ATPase subunit type 1 TsaE [Clostridium sp.]|nr:tRNA (adenosine(37)-N6)-threonylcarbamoyltransferase complex ATPase subunit type 1 TsaE [Clostridium sp.]
MDYNSWKPEDTFEIARQLGEKAVAGDVFCLIGDLGVGKTLFSQGFATGLGIQESVNSPTFTIVQEYDEGRLPFYHFDVYRIEESEEMEEVGFADMIYGEGVCLIEWANLIEDILPEHYTRVTICKELEKGFDYRMIHVDSI